MHAQKIEMIANEPRHYAVKYCIMQMLRDTTTGQKLTYSKPIMNSILHKVNHHLSQAVNFQFTFMAMVVATGMWLLSILGLWGELTTINMVISICLAALISLYGTTFIKNKIDVYQFWPILVIAIIQFSSFFYVIFAPPFVWDEVAYTVALPKLYAEARHFFYASNYGPYSAFPQNYEAITTTSILLFDSPIISKVLNFWFLLSLMLLASYLAFLSGVSKKLSLFAGVIVGCSSELIFFTPIVKNDIASAFFQCWSVAVLATHIRQKSLVNCGLLGALLGTAAGIKYNSLIPALVITIIFTWLTFTEEEKPSKKFFQFLIFAVSLGISAAPWYLKNWVEFNNPLYPIANEFFGAHNYFHAKYSAMFQEALYGDVNFSWANGSIYGFIIRYAKGFGYFAVIFGLLGALRIILSKKNKENGYIAIIFFGISFATLRFGFWEPRYSLVILVLLSALAVNFIQNIFFKDKKFNGNQVFNTFLLCLMCTLVIYGYSRGSRIHGGLISYLQVAPRNAFLKKYVAYWEVADWLNKNTSRESRVAILGPQIFYYLNRPYFNIHPLTEHGDLINNLTAVNLYNFYVKEKIDYICLDNDRYKPTSDATPRRKAFIADFNHSTEELVANGNLKEMSTIDNVIIYKLVQKISHSI